jgi:hypothetical protein
VKNEDVCQIIDIAPTNLQKEKGCLFAAIDLIRHLMSEVDLASAR